jgi:hypothetical protein
VELHSGRLPVTKRSRLLRSGANYCRKKFCSTDRRTINIIATHGRTDGVQPQSGKKKILGWKTSLVHVCSYLQFVWHRKGGDGFKSSRRRGASASGSTSTAGGGRASWVRRKTAATGSRSEVDVVKLF